MGKKTSCIQLCSVYSKHSPPRFSSGILASQMRAMTCNEGRRTADEGGQDWRRGGREGEREEGESKGEGRWR